MPARRKDVEAKETRRKPATTPEGRENEMVSAAIDLAEKQIRSQEVLHLKSLRIF